MPDIYGEMKFRDYILGGGYRHGNEYSAMDHLYGCNYIGKFESLQNHWSKIFKLIGVANDKLPHVNNIGDPEYRDKYDKEMINYIGTRYKDDVKWGRYNFG